MMRRRVNGYDIAYIGLGEDPSLVCLHGTLGDFRVWSPVLGPLSGRRYVLALSCGTSSLNIKMVWDQISRSLSMSTT
jgi:pimeloyl-ACP methyl ester carboxylesterase